MKEQLIKAMKSNQLVNIIYMAKSGEITKRCVRIIKMSGDSFQGYCFVKQAKRTFIIDNVLAVTPVIHRESEVI